MTLTRSHDPFCQRITSALVSLSAIAWIAWIAWISGTSTGWSAEVDARLSSGQAYVDSPITLQIAIEDVSNYQSPKIPDIDGLSIESAGTPRRSSQTTIINGRMTSSESVVLQYDVTPSRTGTFEIPPISVSIDGKIVKTSPLGFVASRSETGDLLLVEIQGKQDRVYVGQSLELTLRIWVKPFRDTELDYTLTEGDLWRSISSTTSWGPFAETLQEMGSNRKRPSGKLVERENADGDPVRYFLYEIDAMMYPKKPGKIDGDSIRIVVDYPVALARQQRRSLFDDVFSGMNSPFSGGFGSQWVIESSRPVAATAGVDETTVIAIPSKGRPDSFLGAVGRYEISANTDSNQTTAGDPITLQIAISGDGPLDTVQAPPLDEVRKRFHLDGQPLAGFVRDATKYFTTTIRPDDESVTEVPAIEMSYFDPQTETFETVATKPIAIQVRPAQRLAMDSIVGPSPQAGMPTNPNGRAGILSWSPLAILTSNGASESALRNQPRSSLLAAAAWIWIVPVVCFLAVWLIGKRGALSGRWWRFRSPRRRAFNDIFQITSGTEIPGILTRYVLDAFDRTDVRPASATPDRWQTCLGRLRHNGHSRLAADLESLAYVCRTVDDTAERRRRLIDQSFAWIEDAERSKSNRFGVRTVKHDHANGGGASSADATTFVICLLAGSVASSGFAADPSVATGDVLLLNRAQQKTLLVEADRAYQSGLSVSEESATAKFEIAAAKYQQIVDSGIENGTLSNHLANAYYRSGQFGRAVAYYRIAQTYQPLNLKTQSMLLLSQAAAGIPIHRWHAPVVFLIVGVVFLIAACSCVTRILFRRRSTARASDAWVPLGFLAIATACCILMLWQTTGHPSDQVVAVMPTLLLHETESTRSAVSAEIRQAEGRVITMKQRRGTWIQLATDAGVEGWIPQDQVIVI